MKVASKNLLGYSMDIKQVLNWVWELHWEVNMRF